MVFPHFNHDVCLFLGFWVFIIFMSLVLYYIERILYYAERLKPPVEFVFSEQPRYCRRCGHEMEPAYQCGDYDSGDWVLDYCPVCVERFR